MNRKQGPGHDGVRYTAVAGPSGVAAIPPADRAVTPVSSGPTERWRMDVVHHILVDGRSFLVLTVVDN